MNFYPLQLEKEFFRTLQSDYNSDMQEVTDELIRNLKKDELLRQRDIKRDSFMDLMGYLGKRIFSYEFLESPNKIKLVGNLIGNYKLLDNWVSSKFNESINTQSKKLTDLRPKQLAIVNGEFKLIYKPLEKFTVTENGIEKVKYNTQGLAITPKVTKVIDEEVLKQKALENALLVKNIKKEKALQLQDIIRDAYYKGKTSDEIIKDIGKVVKGGESRLKNIAQDQVKKFANEVQNQKLAKAGVDKWEWATMGDERVRAKHAAIEGQEFDNITGAQGLLEEPSSKFPGDDWGCRCWKNPVIG